MEVENEKISTEEMTKDLETRKENVKSNNELGDEVTKFTQSYSIHSSIKEEISRKSATNLSYVTILHV